MKEADVPDTRGRPLGITYRGTGDLEVAATAIEEACEIAGMSYRRRELAGGVLRIDADQHDPWRHVLVKGQPQLCEWRLSQARDQLEIYSDFQWFRWFRWLLLGLALLLVLCTAGAVALSLDPSPLGWADILETGLLLAVLLLVLVMYHLLAGGHHREEIRQRVVSRVRTAGGFLEPVGSGVSRRLVMTLGALFCFVLILAAWVILDTRYSGSYYIPASLTAFLGLHLVLVVLLIAAALLMLRRGEFNFRVAPLQTGVMTALCVLMFLSPAALWLGVGANLDVATLEAGEIFLLGRGFPQGWDDDARTDEIRQRMRRHYLPYQALCRQLLIAIVFLVVLAVAAFARLAVYNSITTARILRNYQKSRGRGVYREATRGGPFLRSFLVVFVASWVLFAAAILMVLAFLTVCASQALVPSFSGIEPRLAEVSAAVVSFALGQPIGGGAISVAVRAVWVLHALFGLGILAISAGQLLRDERAELRRLRLALRSSSDTQKELQQAIDSLAAEAGGGRVLVVVSPDRPPTASSRVFGFLQRERFIEISSFCVDRLSREDAVALLAHELAHHRLGHCRRYRLLRWLGRLSFVGDGFVLALQNSWTYEERADRTAVEELGVQQDVLVHALRNLRGMGDRWKRRQEETGGGPRAQPGRLETIDTLLVEEPSERSLRHRWLRAWKLFRRQYFHAMELHYWYPPHRERYSALGGS